MTKGAVGELTQVANSRAGTQPAGTQKTAGFVVQLWGCPKQSILIHTSTQFTQLGVFRIHLWNIIMAVTQRWAQSTVEETGRAHDALSLFFNVVFFCYFLNYFFNIFIGV